MQDKHRQIKNEMIRELCKSSVDESPERFVQTANTLFSKLINYFEAKIGEPPAPPESQMEHALRLVDEIDAEEASSQSLGDGGEVSISYDEPEDPQQEDLGADVVPDPVRNRRNRQLRDRLARGEKVRPAAAPMFDHQNRVAKATEAQEAKLQREYGARAAGAGGLGSLSALMG